MTDKTLQDKAIQIKGKDYVLVSDRIGYFNETYSNGCIQTKLLSDTQADMVVVYAKVIPDLDKPDRFFTGLSQAKWGDGLVNKTAALENCETSAVGRALGMMGIGVIDSVASADEMRKAGVDEPPNDNLKATCKVHNVPMIQKWSEAKQKMYWYHKSEDGQMCFGKGYLERNQ